MVVPRCFHLWNSDTCTFLSSFSEGEGRRYCFALLTRTWSAGKRKKICGRITCERTGKRTVRGINSKGKREGGILIYGEELGFSIFPTDEYSDEEGTFISNAEREGRKKDWGGFFPPKIFFLFVGRKQKRRAYEYCIAHKSEEGKAKVFLFSGPQELLFSDFCTFVSLQMFRKYAEEKSAAEERGIFIRKKVVWETLVVCIRFWRKNLCLICLPRLLPLSPLLENELFRPSLIKTGWR